MVNVGEDSIHGAFGHKLFPVGYTHPNRRHQTTLFCWVRLKLYRGKGLEIEANLSNDKNPGCLEYIGD